jgi:SAM-dependent methyltransferase
MEDCRAMPDRFGSGGLSRQYVKLCEREDFDDPEFESTLAEIVPGLTPEREIHRKHWEYAQLIMYLREVGALREDAAALAVAAGHEEPVFWLANHVGRVVATDIYGQGSFGEREATASMLNDPAAFAPYEYRKDHLEVQDMNALDLRFPDDTFDIVYSLSSIEHFGGTAGAAQGAREMARVLKPGGHLVITTECFIGRHVLDLAPVQYAIRLATFGRRCGEATPRRRATEVFTPAELRRSIVDASGLELVQPLDTKVSEASFENLARMGADGQPTTASGSVFPHIVLQAFGAPWTSVCLALRKP